MSIAALVQALVDAGASGDVILAAVKAVEASKVADDEARRAAVRARVTKHRALKRAVTLHDVSIQEAVENSTKKVVSAGSDENAPLYVEEKEHKKKGKRESSLDDKRGTRLPQDWMPSEADAAYGATLGFTSVAYDREVEKFRNHWHTKPGKDALKLDWSKTFRNWLLRGAERFAPAKEPYRPTVVQTAQAVFIERGSPQWQAWTRHRGKEPIAIHHGGKDGQFMRTEWPPQESAA